MATTYIPNIIIDEWMRHLTDEEFMVLMYLCRIQFSSSPAKYNPEEYIKLPLKEIEAALSSLQEKRYIDEQHNILIAKEENE